MRRLAWLVVLGVLAAGGGAEAQDWPQYRHDAARTGGSPMKLSGESFMLRWAWFGENQVATQRLDFPARREEGFEGVTQPIVADGRVYVGALSGRFFAIDADTGRTVWKYQTALPIVHSAAYADGRVFVPGMDLTLYALDAETGRLLWSGPAEAGFSTAPLVVGDLVVAASRDGVVHAWSAATGQPRWTYDCGAPVFNTPASDGRRVFLAGEDTTAHAINLADGTQAWTAKLAGQSARNYSPVVADGVVYFRTMPVSAERPTDAPADPAALREYLRRHPTRQTAFALDVETGQVADRLWDIAALETAGSDAPKPPVVLQDGSVITAAKLRIDPLRHLAESLDGFYLSGAGDIILGLNGVHGIAADLSAGEAWGVIRKYKDPQPLPGEPYLLYVLAGLAEAGPMGGAGESGIVPAEGRLYMTLGALVAVDVVKGGQP